jgi:hypothetical protein
LEHCQIQKRSPSITRTSKSRQKFFLISKRKTIYTENICAPLRNEWDLIIFSKIVLKNWAVSDTINITQKVTEKNHLKHLCSKVCLRVVLSLYRWNRICLYE